MTGKPDTEATPPRSLRRNLIAGTVGTASLLGGVGGWAATREFSGAVIASGILVVAELLVKEAWSVSAGETIARLDATVTRTNLAAASKNLDYLYARQARLKAERDGLSAVETNPILLQRLPAGKAESAMLSERRSFLRWPCFARRTRARLRQQVQQLREQIAGVEVQSKAKGEEIGLIEKELEGLRRLFEIGGITMSQVNALEPNAARLRGERGQLIASIASAKGRIFRNRASASPSGPDHAGISGGRTSRR